MTPIKRGTARRLGLRRPVKVEGAGMFQFAVAVRDWRPRYWDAGISLDQLMRHRQERRRP